MICEDIMTWRKRPVIYEIATWVWLDELRLRIFASMRFG